jgi:hypothetical protein
VLLAHSGLAEPAERQLVVDDLAGVDPGVAGLEPLRRDRRRRKIPRPDGRAEPELRSVRALDRLVEPADLPDRQRWAEHLLDGDLGVVRWLEDQRRLVEPAARELVVMWALATDEQLSTSGERRGHLLFQGLPL